MSARTEPAGWPQPRNAIEDAAVAWLDALAGGICTPEAFLSAMRDQFQGDRDEGWGILSLLDQYYRRGKIKAELFHALKARLEGSALDGDNNVPAGMRPNAATAVAPSAVAPSAVTAPVGDSPQQAPSAARPAVQQARKVQEVAIGHLLRGRYRVRGVLGQGGMGTVFEAIDE